MKKLLLAVLSCVMFFCCCLFAGCGESTGTYKLQKIEMTSKYGDVLIYEVGENWGGLELTKESIIIILNEDGKGFIRVCDVDEDEEDVEVDCFEWSEGYDGEIYAIVGSSVRYRAVRDGSTLKVYYDDDTVIYLKK